MEKKYLYGLTVQGIQSYIFETNKLREIVGGSEIVENITRKILPEILKSSFDEKKLLLAAAGNVKYLFSDKFKVQKVIQELPEKIAIFSKSIKYSQAVVEIKGNLNDSHYRELEKKLNAKRNKPNTYPDMLSMGRNLNRVTGKAEYNFRQHKSSKDSFDFDNYKKRGEEDGKLLLEKIDSTAKYTFPKEISEITNDQSKNYIAIIHADGNKLGSTIQKIVNKDFEEKEQFLKELSIQIENSTIIAFKKAFYEVVTKDTFKHEKKVPLRPIILGGDDLTLIIRADLAISFAKVYLNEFERQTKKNFASLMKSYRIVNTDMLENLEGGLTATAGIVFIKEKYPFHYAVSLVEKITTKAKNITERKDSSILFYKVKDSFINSYDDIIKEELSPNNYNFMNGPYCTKEIEELQIKLSVMKSDETPKSALRELLTLMYQNQNKAEFKWKRIWQLNNRKREFQKFNFDEQLENNKLLYDLITLDSLTTGK